MNPSVATFSLENRIILLTGAAGLLGTPMARQIAEAGAHVILNGRSKEKLENLAEEIQSAGHSCTVMAFDVSDEAAIDTAVVDITKKFGKLHGIVNNAYAGPTGNVASSTPQQTRDSLNYNITMPFYIVQQCLPLLKKGREDGFSSAVVNIASMYGVVSPDPRIYGDSGFNNPPFYGAGKAGLIQVTKYLACHLATEGVRVNSISPGPFPPDRAKTDHPEFYEKLRLKVPMERTGQPGEISGAVQFLLSDAASFITGINLPVDGGWTAN
ncbi:MAG: SDR family oxidoreductase [Alphaproteobacteria bacterium]|nr:SDR family oxidoreductase [Alphaproteobacteria bacterium]